MQTYFAMGKKTPKQAKIVHSFMDAFIPMPPEPVAFALTVVSQHKKFTFPPWVLMTAVRFRIHSTDGRLGGRPISSYLLKNITLIMKVTLTGSRLGVRSILKNGRLSVPNWVRLLHVLYGLSFRILYSFQK
jgi:hypothetical protein